MIRPGSDTQTRPYKCFPTCIVLVVQIFDFGLVYLNSELRKTYSVHYYISFEKFHNSIIS